MIAFSVIIPTYNRSRLLREALRSVFAQEYTDYEVIVVDDGSTENIAAVTREFGECVKYFRQENCGPGAARNLGIAHATGEYITFLDSDDLCFPWTLPVYASVIQRCRSPAFVAGKSFQFRDDHKLKHVQLSEIRYAEFADYYASGDEWRWWGASSFVIRSDVLRSVKGFTSLWVNAEDADLAMRVGTAPGFVQVTDPCTFAYREHTASAMADIERTVAGTRHMIEQEQNGKYPGGDRRFRERIRILTRHVRPVSLALIRQRDFAEAWKLYRSTLVWHARQRRCKYLLGFPLRLMLARLGSAISGKVASSAR
jgi:glycosyltransferase involved in cell wall biosynthesis